MDFPRKVLTRGYQLHLTLFLDILFHHRVKKRQAQWSSLSWRSGRWYHFSKPKLLLRGCEQRWIPPGAFPLLSLNHPFSSFSTSVCTSITLSSFSPAFSDGVWRGGVKAGVFMTSPHGYRFSYSRDNCMVQISPTGVWSSVCSKHTALRPVYRSREWQNVALETRGVRASHASLLLQRCCKVL